VRFSNFIRSIAKLFLVLMFFANYAASQVQTVSDASSDSATQSKATYNIIFNSIWNVADHTSVPGGAHWSKLVGVTHKTSNTFLQLGEMATTGIKNIAEAGNNTVFNSEVNTKITNGEADQYINGPSLGTGPGVVVINSLEVDENFPLLTLVSMIAPSPDWIIALNSYSLLDANKQWKNSVTLDVFGYDAGTDSGTNYTSSNIITDPVESISMINSSPLNGKKIGTITISLQSVPVYVGGTLDIDGNGQYDALTDGLLALRFLFGLEGDALINGAVAIDATRTSAEEIEAHLETLMPTL
jgi:hypothetical protein